ncbi:MAG: hypothetical protein H6874_00100 [Hyphomicrobiaceae bacterium]|nr:hypothetical protein [Hyphomicrobiaceae bacterium]
MHVLVFGQSNVANRVRPTRACKWAKVHFDGHVSELSDPIPGASGRKGSVWSRVAHLVKRSGQFQSFCITNVAKGSTSVADWLPEGELFAALCDQAAHAEAINRPVTCVFFHQGERDNFLGTTAADYFETFKRIHSGLILRLGSLPIIVCQASHRAGITSEAVRNAQNQIQGQLDVVPGPDTDLLGDEFRYDGTHLNALGADRFAQSIFETLLTCSPETTPAES